MALREKIRKRFIAGMMRRIHALRERAEASLDVAGEILLQDQVDSYVRIEQGLLDIDRTLNVIAVDVENIHESSAAQRIESRLEFLEDRLEEFDSELHQRPPRRRRRIHLFNLLNGAGESRTDSVSSRGEIASATQAYEVLGLAFGSPLSVVRKTFRQQVKTLHPDFLNGDQRSEPELRRMIEAYQYLKNDLPDESMEISE